MSPGRRLLAGSLFGVVMTGSFVGLFAFNADANRPADVPAGWVVIDAPEGFGDVAAMCFYGTRVFISSDDVKATSSIVAIRDPGCPS